jgi:hypothetical protein
MTQRRINPARVGLGQRNLTSRTNETELEITLDEDATTWFGEPVCASEGPPERLTKLIPHFDRRPFAMGSLASIQEQGAEADFSSGENRLCDLIVRMPLRQTERETPVGVVAKRYTLVQHRDLIERACDAIKAASIDLSHVTAKLVLSSYGSKMVATFTLPQEFDFDPGDGHTLNLSFHCVNSVDGECRLRIMLGWFRFICGNGLIVGTARLSQRFVHNEYLELPDLAHVLIEGLRSAEQEKASLVHWTAKTVEEGRLDKWADGPLREEWGPLGAARVHLICMTGQDGRFANPGEKAPPHRKSMIRTRPVPGAPSKAGNAYHVAQALAWVASIRKDIQGQLDGMVAIPKLMGALLE